MGKVSIDAATKEVEAWLDYKKVDSEKRAASSDNIEGLAKAISSGSLRYNPKDNTFTQSLKWPIGEDSPINELTYKSRLSMKDVTIRTKNVNSGDAFGLIQAYVCALTGQNSGIIGCLDTEDNRTAQSIASFFL
jgi:hypothetical protein